MSYIKNLLCTSLFLTQMAGYAVSLEASQGCQQCASMQQLSSEAQDLSMIQVKSSKDTVQQTAPMQAPASIQKVKKQKDLPFKVTGEFLYLRAIEDGLSYGTTSTVSPPVAQPPANSSTWQIGGAWGEVNALQPSFDAGYRINLAYAPSNEHIGVFTQWMHYQTKTEQSIPKTPFPAPTSTGVSSLIWPVFGIHFQNPNAQSANANWSLKMDVVDLALGTTWNPKSRVSIDSFAGFRGARIAQELTAGYNNIYLNQNSTQSYGAINVNYDWKNQGYGLMGGLNTTIMLGKGFSFFGKGCGSLLMGRSNPLFTQQLNDNEGNPINNASHVTRSFFVTTPVFEMLAGIGYGHNWKKVGFDVKVGWEEQFWGNQNFVSYFLSQNGSGFTMSNQGALSLGGYNFSASLKF